MLGFRKVPVSREQIMSSTDLPLATRAFHLFGWCPIEIQGLLHDINRAKEQQTYAVRWGV